MDDADYEWLSAFKWCALKRKSGGFDAVRGIPKGRGRWTHLRMSRALLPGTLNVDHVNRNSLDNQRHNLRPATHSQNAANRGLDIDNSSGFKGVWWRKDRNKWLASIRVQGRRYILGLFSDVKEAAVAYDKAAREKFGAFACLNFPEKRTNECHGSTQTAPNCSL